MTEQLERRTKIISICGGFRHFDEMLAFRDNLMEHGASCEWPAPELRRDLQTMTDVEAKAAIFTHLEYALRSIPDQFLMRLLSGVVSPKGFIECACPEDGQR